MSEYSQLSFPFATISGKKVTADFSGGEVTSDAGLLLLREWEQQTGIISQASRAILDPRHSSYITYSMETLIKQRVLQIACGYEDALDCNALRSDPALKAACDHLPSEPDLASQSTLSRLENAITKTNLLRLALALVDRFIATHVTPPESILMDIDDTDDTTYSAQQLQLFNGYYDDLGFNFQVQHG